MKKYLQKFTYILVIMCVICTGCTRKPVIYQKADTAMGTIINRTIYASTEEAAQEVSAKIDSCISDLEQKHLSWRLETSEIYRINAEAGSGQSVEMSPLLADVLEQSKKVYAASNGAFDFSMGSVVRLWDIDSRAVMQQTDFTSEENSSKMQLPTDAQIAEALKYVGVDKSNIDGSFISLPGGMQLDLGAVGKGIVLDEVYALLQAQENVTGAVISAGGSILTYGTKPDGTTWNVGIVDPFDTSENIGILALPGGCSVSTSGDYERFIEVEGIRYHHILNPFTGKPSDSGVRSVTILCTGGVNKGLFSDALSTACFVLGAEEGLVLAECFDAEALFVDSRGEIHMTDGMKQFFYLSNSGK